jgi:hypothetical protein
MLKWVDPPTFPGAKMAIVQGDPGKEGHFVDDAASSHVRRRRERLPQTALSSPRPSAVAAH